MNGKKEALGGRRLENRVPLWGSFWTPFRHFFFRGPPGHKKRVSGRAFETRPVFWSLLESARRPSGGFPSRREINVHFCSRPKKGSKMGAKMERFGLPNPNYTRFGAPWARNWCPKNCVEKKEGKNELVRHPWGRPGGMCGGSGGEGVA